MAATVEDDERAELLARMVEVLPGLTYHVAATSRAIPVVVIIEAADEHLTIDNYRASSADPTLQLSTRVRAPIECGEASRRQQGNRTRGQGAPVPNPYPRGTRDRRVRP